MILIDIYIWILILIIRKKQNHYRFQKNNDLIKAVARFAHFRVKMSIGFFLLFSLRSFENKNIILLGFMPC